MGKKNKNSMETNLQSLNPSSVCSEFHVPGINYRFSNEPVWMKFVIYIISLGFILLTAYLVKEWVVALLAKDAVVSNVTRVMKSIKGKDP